MKKETDRMDVTESTVETLVGTPVFTHDRIYEETPPGVVMGLAWTSLGLLFICQIRLKKPFLVSLCLKFAFFLLQAAPHYS